MLTPVAPETIETIAQSPTTGQAPLVVDLDGTLINSDLLIETAFAYLGQNPAKVVDLFSALSRGKAALKAKIAAAIDVDASLLPYNGEVLKLIHQARSEGRQIYLASASNEKYVRA